MKTPMTFPPKKGAKKAAAPPAKGAKAAKPKGPQPQWAGIANQMLGKC